MTIEEKIHLARRARELLENEAFREVFEHLSGETVKQWRATPSGAGVLREQLFAQIGGLDAIKAQLEQWVEQGEYEAARLEKARERQERTWAPKVFSRDAR